MLQPYIITYILQEIYKSHWIQNERHRNEIKQSIHAHMYYHIETCFLLKFK